MICIYAPHALSPPPLPHPTPPRSEAVYNSMVATASAVGLSPPVTEEQRRAAAANPLAPPPSAPVAEEAAESSDPEAFSYQDMSQPIEIIARRLQRYHARLVSNPAMWAERQRRLLHASFIVEFGLEHGLPDKRDPTSEATLKDFLARLGEWEGGGSSENVRSLVLDSIPDGPAKEPLRKTTMEWFEENRGAAIVGGAIIGGVLGVLVAGATVALASSRGRRPSR